jgi:F-type H+-transporting ATPase subunit b
MDPEAVQTTGTIVAPAGGHESAGATGFMQPNVSVMVFTWIIFGVMCWLLYKVAWKPILYALEHREKTIKKSLADAEKARAEAAAMETRRQEMIRETEVRRRELMAAAELTATEQADAIHKKAQLDAADLMESARREIQSATEKARTSLRQETVDIAVELAGKIIGQQVDRTRSQAMLNEMMREYTP